MHSMDILLVALTVLTLSKFSGLEKVLAYGQQKCVPVLASKGLNMKWADFVRIVTRQTENEEFVNHQALNPSFLKLSEEQVNQQDKIQNVQHRQFPCEVYAVQKDVTTVHTLTPADISVIGAMGDSVTVGNGIKGTKPEDLTTLFRGLSFSAGGDGTIEEHITLPNIIKKYNPALKGYATGVGPVISNSSHLNVAVSGDASFDLPRQAEELVRRMHRREEGIDFENDWKIITIYIGINDLCHYCVLRKMNSASNYVSHIQKALDILHQKVPKTFVNVMLMRHIDEMSEIKGTWLSDHLHEIMCPCGIHPKDVAMVREGVNLYQKGVADLVASGRYDTKPDFTVVAQPFLTETHLPRLEDGSLDFNYSTVDYYHPNEKGEENLAVGLWNNMVQPVGLKSTQMTPFDTVLCPSEERPYFYTRLNSHSHSIKKVPTGSDAVARTQHKSESDRKEGNSPGTAGLYAGTVVVLISGIVLMAYFIVRQKKKKVGERTVLLRKELDLAFVE